MGDKANFEEPNELWKSLGSDRYKQSIFPEEITLVVKGGEFRVHPMHFE